MWVWWRSFYHLNIFMLYKMIFGRSRVSQPRTWTFPGDPSMSTTWSWSSRPWTPGTTQVTTLMQRVVQMSSYFYFSCVPPTFSLFRNSVAKGLQMLLLKCQESGYLQRLNNRGRPFLNITCHPVLGFASFLL